MGFNFPFSLSFEALGDPGSSAAPGFAGGVSGGWQYFSPSSSPSPCQSSKKAMTHSFMFESGHHHPCFHNLKASLLQYAVCGAVLDDHPNAAAAAF